MKIISVFDTTISEYNLGNQIIMDSVQRELNEIFNDKFQYNIPYQQVNRNIRKCFNQSDYVFFGGTNSLTSFMNKYKQWDINLLKTRYVKDVIMMGIGWWQYQDDPNYYTKLILSRALSKDYYHSVRDSYTADKLRKLGFKVINTGCPTTWGLTKEKLKKIEGLTKKDSVVITFTDYNKDFKNDKKLLEICKKNYKHIFAWPQGVGDLEYIKKLDDEGIVTIIGANLKSFDDILKNENIDYIGTRLHAGMRALQHDVRALFVAIDNRTIEIGKDIGIPYIKRDCILDLEELINSKYNSNFNINYKAIEKWKNQFK